MGYAVHPFVALYGTGQHVQQSLLLPRYSGSQALFVQGYVI